MGLPHDQLRDQRAVLFEFCTSLGGEHPLRVLQDFTGTLLIHDHSRHPMQEACELIDWYRARWEIELFFNVPADLLFGADEWRAAFILNKKAVPTANTVIRLIAQFGGFLGEERWGSLGPRPFGWACTTPENLESWGDLCTTERF